MPCVIRKLTANGLVDVTYSASSLADAVQYESNNGVYTVANTVNTYGVIKLTAHLDRLHDSAERENIAFDLPHHTLRSALREVIDIANFGDVRFRITVTQDAPDEPILSVEPFSGYPDTIYTDGVRVITAPNAARRNPAAKDTGWMHSRAQLIANKPDDAHEVILLDAEGLLLEGTGSNFYAILRDTLYTALDGVLGGISRQIVFETAPAVIPLVRHPVHQSDIPNLQEAFITSSSRGIVPVIQIDDTRIGSGLPGNQTLAIREQYLNWVDENIELL